MWRSCHSGYEFDRRRYFSTAEGYLYSVVYTVFGLNRDGDTTTDYENDMDLAVAREWSRTSSAYRTFLTKNAAGGGGGNFLMLF